MAPHNLRPLPLLASLALTAMFATTAAADQAICMDDADCAPGEICVEIPCPGDCEPVWEAYCMSAEDGSGEGPPPSGVPPMPMPEPDYGCDSNADCDEDEYCLDTIGECVPDWFVACANDSDCGAGLRCIDIGDMMGGSGSWEDDTDAVEPLPFPGERDGAPKSGGVLPEESSYCLPEWLNPEPCTSDADCADGFACERAEICACGGWGGEPGAGGGWDGPEPDFDERQKDDPECECWLEEEAYCQLQEIECSSASDCPEDWTCEAWHDADGVCAVDSDGNEWCDEPSDAPESVCLPPFYGDIGGVGAGGGEFDEAIGGAPRPGGPGAGPADEQAADGDDFLNRPDAESSGGCSAASGTPAPLPWSLLLVGLIALSTRRRDEAAGC